jgi:methionine sulfoxide reductase heme-binding subunit
VNQAATMPRRFFTQPWHERTGQLSWLKLAVFLALFAPGLWTLIAYVAGNLGARPLSEIIHQTGLWTIRFLLISLAITPLRRSLRWPRLVLVRRMVGVAAFAYGLAHFSTYIVDESFNLVMVASEIAFRLYLTIGFAALLLMGALALTSTDGMIKRLGGKRWRRLHQLAYGIGLLALLHYFMQSKLGFGEPLLMAALFGWSMGYRLIGWVRSDEGALAPWVVIVLSLVAGSATALGESLYVHLYFHVDLLRVLAANLAWTMGSRSAWSVIAIGLAIAVAGVYRGRVKRQQRRNRPRLMAAEAAL